MSNTKRWATERALGLAARNQPMEKSQHAFANARCKEGSTISQAKHWLPAEAGK